MNSMESVAIRSRSCLNNIATTARSTTATHQLQQWQRRPSSIVADSDGMDASHMQSILEQRNADDERSRNAFVQCSVHHIDDCADRECRAIHAYFTFPHFSEKAKVL